MKTDKNTFLDTAWHIGCELMASAIWHNGSCNWQGYSMEAVNGQFKSVMRTFGSDMYSGTSGIAAFLVALYSEKQDPVLLKTIEGCLSQIKSNMQDLPDQGFYSGKPGVAALLLKAGKTLNNKKWINDGLTLLKRIKTDALKDHEIDLISGAAGTIPVLLDAYETYKDKQLLNKATSLGDILCHVAKKNGDVWSWSTVPSKKNLTGFSHGSSGVALALLHLYKVTKNKNYSIAAIRGFNYERTSFDNTQQNWPDFRDDVVKDNQQSVCGLAWCHGAPGIAISRYKANQLQEDTMYVNEMHIALNTTTTNVYNAVKANLETTNFSLCHGAAGNAEVLLDCGQDDHIKLAEAVGVAGIKKYKEQHVPWPSGLNTNQYTPGLMMGLAGTGYFYLRLFNKEKHGSLLLASA